MTPIALEAARTAAISALAKIRASESERLNALALIDAMIAGYQAQWLASSAADAEVIRIGAAQLQRIRSGLTEKDIKAVGLFLP